MWKIEPISKNFIGWEYNLVLSMFGSDHQVTRSFRSGALQVYNTSTKQVARN